MRFRAPLVLACCFAATASFALTGSAHAPGNRVTAQFANDDTRLKSVAIKDSGGTSARGIKLHSWYVDSEGAILLAAVDGVAVPARATSLVVLAEPVGLRRTSTAVTPAQVTQITLPKRLQATPG